ncbi:MAG: asparagine synthase (glutamine-hydrolyzing), partial [Spirochaetaceae bacterium]|nr:asparagine synthase (glutamine-hydrolyzing) [Spirochaetaceae bacterium]
MCGITGVWNRQNKDISSHVLFSMLQVQRHRGPDGQGVVLWGVDKYKDRPFFWKGKKAPPADIQIRLRLGLGHNLLSIQDSPENSRQPLVSKNGRYWLVYNGEIYNFIELRDELINKGVVFETNSDAEVLLALWETYEAESIKMLRGMFAFLVYDTYKNTLCAVRDRFGIKPLYYARLPDNLGLLFASEIHTFFVSDLLQKSCRDDALLGFLAGAVNKPDDSDTIYANIQEIPPGNFLIVKECETQMIEYYQPVRLLRSQKKEILTESQIIKELKDLFIDTVNIHLRSSREVGTCLSGGLDSTNIAYAIKSGFRKEIASFKAFTIGDRQSLDSRLSEVAAGQLSIEHKNFNSPAIIQEHDIIDMIKTCEIPNHTWGPINQYYLLRNIKGEFGIQVLLDGQGGDEVFSGYPWFFKPVYQNLLEKGETVFANEIYAKFYQNPPLPKKILDYATKLYFSKDHWIRSFEGGAIKALGLTEEKLMSLNSV